MLEFVVLNRRVILIGFQRFGGEEAFLQQVNQGQEALLTEATIFFFRKALIINRRVGRQLTGTDRYRHMEDYCQVNALWSTLIQKRGDPSAFQFSKVITNLKLTFVAWKSLKADEICELGWCRGRLRLCLDHFIVEFLLISTVKREI